MIRVSCPKCKAIVQVEDKQAGQVIACSNCKTSLRLPPAPAAAPAPPVVAKSSAPSPTVPKGIATPPVLPAVAKSPTPSPTVPKTTQTPPVLPVAQPAPAPAQFASAQPATSESPASTLLARFRQGPMGKWLTPRMIAIGCGSVASVTLAFVILLVVIVSVFNRGSGGPSGGGSGNKKSYTQRVLDLKSEEQKEYGVKIPNGAKALFSPGSAEDFMQSLTLFGKAKNNFDLVCFDTKESKRRYGTGTIADLNNVNGIRYVYEVQHAGGVFMSQKCWDTIYGSPIDMKTVNESNKGPGDSGATFNSKGQPQFLPEVLIPMNHWKLPCTNETLLLRGENLKLVQGYDPKTAPLKLVFINFNKRLDDICPKKGDGSERGLSFKY